MNIRLWELDNGDLISLEKIICISPIKMWYELKDEKGYEKPYWVYRIYLNVNEVSSPIYYKEDEAKLARFKLIERWNACLDMIHDQTWCPEAGTYSSSSKPIKEDKYEGYREKDERSK